MKLKGNNGNLVLKNKYTNIKIRLSKLRLKIKETNNFTLIECDNNMVKDIGLLTSIFVQNYKDSGIRTHYLYICIYTHLISILLLCKTKVRFSY